MMTLLAHGLGVSRLGLMHHFHRRFPVREPDTAMRSYAGAVQEATEVLAIMADGVIHDFRIDI